MGNKQKKPDLADIAMDLQMTAKQLEKQSVKLESQEKAERKKILDALNKNQMENAKVFAENVIRQRKEAINLRRFGVKMGALASKISSAARTQDMATQISQTVPLLQSCMKKMDALGVNGSIADFEKVFEDMDVKTEEMNGALDNVYSSSIDNGEVANLLQEIKDQQAMETGGQINAGTGTISAQKQQEIDAMQAKINEMKNL